MKQFLGRCLMAWLALVFSVPALAQQVTKPVEIQVEFQDQKKGSGSGSGSTPQSKPIPIPGNLTLSPSLNPPLAPANNNLTVSSGSPPSTKWGVTGKLTSTCGGLNANGTLQDPCGPTPARFEAVGAGGCAAGSFAAQGTCWTCPQGFTRNIDHGADSDRACSRPDGSLQAQLFAAKFIGPVCPDGSVRRVGYNECWACPAGFERAPAAGLLSDNACRQSGVPPLQAGRAATAFVQKADCQPGEITDPRNGGECWVCPGVSARTANPIAGPQACRVPGGVRFANATQGEVRQCAPGQTHYLVDARNVNVANQIRTQFGGNVPAEVQQTLGSTHGTCWTCPAESKRSAAPVWGDKACGAVDIQIEPAAYVQPGLFGLAGAEDVALALIRERTMIESLARAVAVETGQPAGAAVRDTWDDIARAPQSSLVLQAALLSRIQAAAVEPQKASAAERQLVTSFATAILAYRVYAAQTSLDAYDLWFKTDQVMRTQRNQGNLISLFDYGVPPPDLEAISAAGIGGMLGSHAGATAALTAVMRNPALRKLVFPFRDRVAKKGAEVAVKTTAKVGTALAKKIGVKLVVSGAAKAASTTLLALGSAGPQIIITAAVELISMSVEQIIDIATARPKLEIKLRHARAVVDPGRMMQTDEGSAEIENQWALVIANPNAPPRLAEIAMLANANLNAPQVAEVKPAAAKPAAEPPRFMIVATNGVCLGIKGAALELGNCSGGARWVTSPDGAGLMPAGSNQCLTAGANGTTVTVTPCTNPRPASQNWQYTASNGLITSISAQRCLEAAPTGPALNACNPRAPFTPAQQWAVRP